MFLKKSPVNPIPSKVDVVYTWVNGENPAYIQYLSQYTSDPKKLNPERYRDLYQMLKYSIRSVLQFMPWINHIYIVTMRPQVPEWLNLDSDRVSIIHHDEIFPNDAFLPAFNSNAIESYLYRIPNISPYYIYFNDDYFIGRPLTINDWFTPNGEIKIYGTLLGKYTNFKLAINFTKRVFSFLSHCPLLMHKPSWEKLEKKWGNQLDQKTRCNQFRTDSDIPPDFLYRYFFQSSPTIPTYSVPIQNHLKNYVFCKILNNEQKTRKKATEILNKKPRFFCLNDDQRNNPNPNVCDYIQSFLNNYFPHPCDLEL